MARRTAPVAPLPPWYADEGGLYPGKEPHFYDPARFDWAQRLCASWTVVRDELVHNLDATDQAFRPYMDGDMTSRPGRWKTLGLMFWRVRSHSNTRAMPEAWKLVKDIPGITACSFNLLEPQTTIKPHLGNTDAIIRCHLGLVIPEPAPRCGLRVGTETRSWEEGGLLMFCDAHEHTAWNNSDRPRYVMVIDVMRDAFLSRTDAICTRVHADVTLDAARKQKPWLDAVCGVRPGLAAARAFHRGVSRGKIAVGE